MTAPNPLGFVVAATGFVYTAPALTAAPSATNTALSAPTTPWTELGNVGSGAQGGDNLPTWSSDGGDKTVLGSWARHAIRTITAPITEAITIPVSDFNRSTLQYYTGADGGSVTGVFAVNGTEIGNSTERALLVVIHDGALRLGFYAPRVALSRGDDFTPAPDDALVFPLSATLLDPPSGARYEWLSEDLLDIP